MNLRLVSPLFACSLMFAGCSDDPTGPQVQPAQSLTVDAATDWVYVSLAGSPEVRSVTDPATSEDWDIAFQATSVRLNGGAGGPADVGSYCICQNAGATSEEYQAMTPDTELADFEAVTAADIPSDAGVWDAGWDGTSGVFETQKWYKYDLNGQHQIWPTFDVYLVKRGTSVYKVQIINYYGPAGEVRQISIRYARIAE